MGDDTFKKQFKKIDERFDKIDEKFIKVDKRFDNLETSQTKMATAIVVLQEEMKEVKENMATKDDIRQVVQGNDKVIKMLIKKSPYEG